MNRSVFVLGLGSSVIAATRPARSDSPLDRYMAPHVEMAEFQGVVSIAPRGAEAAVNAFGGTFTDASRFKVASIAKTFTAATVVALAEAGKLTVDDRLGTFLPAFASSPITIRQLLDHESGIPDIYSLAEFALGHRAPISRNDYIALLAGEKPQFAPGTDSSYSNSGYALLAFATETIAGEPFAKVQRRLILDPLGLHDTDVLPGSELVMGADPGAPNATRPAEPLDPSWLIGNGSLYSTVADVQRWLRAIRLGSTVNLRSWEYPWGWGQKSKGRVLDGDGRYAGFACDALVDLENGDAVVVLGAIQSAVVNVVARDLFASIGGTPLVPAIVRSFVGLDAGEAAGYAGSYRLSKTFGVSVQASNDAIQLAGPDGVFEALDPMGTDRFYFRVLDTALTFKRGANAVADSIDWGPGAFTLRREG